MNDIDREKSVDALNEQLPLRRQAIDGILFVFLLCMSAVALAVITVATPVVLAISSLLGIIRADQPSSNWRPARA